MTGEFVHTYHKGGSLIPIFFIGMGMVGKALVTQAGIELEDLQTGVMC